MNDELEGEAGLEDDDDEPTEAEIEEGVASDDVEGEGEEG